MGSKKSAGILLFRKRDGKPEVLLVHPGGPFWARKDEGAWSLPKGEYENGEDPLLAAVRELKEETGASVTGPFIRLSPLRQKSGKVIDAWACEGDFSPGVLKSNLFSMEWPPRSGKFRDFPEVDRAEWFSLEAAFSKLNPGQHGFLTELSAKLRQVK